VENGGYKLTYCFAGNDPLSLLITGRRGLLPQGASACACACTGGRLNPHSTCGVVLARPMPGRCDTLGPTLCGRCCAGAGAGGTLNYTFSSFTPTQPSPSTFRCEAVRCSAVCRSAVWFIPVQRAARLWECRRRCALSLTRVEANVRSCRFVRAQVLFIAVCWRDCMPAFRPIATATPRRTRRLPLSLLPSAPFALPVPVGCASDCGALPGATCKWVFNRFFTTQCANYEQLQLSRQEARGHPRTQPLFPPPPPPRPHSTPRDATTSHPGPDPPPRPQYPTAQCSHCGSSDPVRCTNSEYEGGSSRDSISSNTRCSAEKSLSRPEGGLGTAGGAVVGGGGRTAGGCGSPVLSQRQDNAHQQ
jgi:hypothetical protein